MCDRHDETHADGRGVTRRGFISGAGAVAAVAGLAGGTAEAAPVITDPEAMVRLTLSVNGRVHHLLVEPRWSLLYVLRERLGLTGTKVGCERGECGACTVLIDDRPRYACMTLALEAEGHEITTLEGLMRRARSSARSSRRSSRRTRSSAATARRARSWRRRACCARTPTRPATRSALGMSGNLCRCGAYAHIFKAVDRAAAAQARAGGES